MTNCILCILDYFDKAVHAHHMISDIDEVDDDLADLFGKIYQSSLSSQLDNKEEVAINIPDLTVANSWCDFKEKFILNLSTVKGTRGNYLNDVIVITACLVTHANTMKTYVNTIESFDNETTCTSATHFSNSFKEDN